MEPSMDGAHHLSAKWDRYFSSGNGAPFDTGRPSSQLVDYLCSCLADAKACCQPGGKLTALASTASMCLPPEGVDMQQRALHVCEACAALKPTAGGRALEVGCGTGASARWLAQCGFRVTAVDISPCALQTAAAAAAAAGLPPDNPTWLLQDVFQLETTQGFLQPGFDFVYDCQVYHVLVRDQAEHKGRLPQLLHDLLAPGGLLMILAGNANEPEVGPNVMTAEQLLQPLLEAGLELVLLRQTRFDSTDYYVNVLKKRPLAWWVVLQRPRRTAVLRQEEHRDSPC